MKERVRTALAITTMLAANTLAQSSESEDQIFSIHELCRSPQATPEDLQAYLDLQVDINAPDDVFQRTPLMWACRSNLDASFIKHLIQCGADVRAQDDQGRSALHHTAAKNINAEILASLINAGANLHQTDNRGHTALHLASQNNPSIETVSMLLRAGSPIDQKNKDGCTALHLAAGSNPNAEIVSVLIRAGSNIQEQDSAGWSPLHHACSPYANHDAFQTLLTAGADVSARDRRGRLPLHHAIEQDESITKSCLLILHGSDINAQEFPAGDTPLKLAAIKRNLSLLALLVDSGADVNAKSFNGNGPESTFHTDPEDPCLLFLKSRGLDLSDHLPMNLMFGKSPATDIPKWATLGVDFDTLFESHFRDDLMSKLARDRITGRSAYSGRVIDYLAAFFQVGVNINGHFSSTKWKSRAIDLNGFSEKVRKLCRTSVYTDIDFESYSFTLTHFFVSMCTQEDVERILDLGADLNAQDSYGNTPLHFSAGVHTNILDVLLERGASVNKANRLGNTPLGTYLSLHSSSSWADSPRHTINVVSSFLKHGADANSLIYLGQNDPGEGNGLQNITFPLHLAIQTTNDFRNELVPLLLDAGANVNQLDSAGVSPLHYAVESWDDGHIMLLINAGANVNQPNALGQSPLHYTTHTEVASLLIDNGANVNQIDPKGQSPLHSAIKRMNYRRVGLPLVKLLMRAGADINQTNSDGQSALHLAATEEDSELLMLLMDAGANVNQRDALGRVPLDLAEKNSRLRNKEALKRLRARTHGRNRQRPNPNQKPRS